MSIRPGQSIAPIYARASPESGVEWLFAGTGFCLIHPDYLVTAHHVVAKQEMNDLVIVGFEPNRRYGVVEKHEFGSLDIAVLRLSGVAPSGFRALRLHERQYGLGKQVFCYGYPYRNLGAERIEFEPRLLSGSFQRFFRYRFDPYEYDAGELSFPVPLGMSGGPLFLHENGNVVAVATTNFESSTAIDYVEEHLEPGHKEVHKITKVVEYGVCAILDSHRDELKNLIPKPD